MTALRHAAAALLAAAALASLACAGDRPLAPDEDARGDVTVHAAITGTAVEGLSIEVTGPGIATPVIANIPAAGLAATGTVAVPAGRARLFVVRGFDTGGIQTHEGSTTADVRPGANSGVAVTLLPLTGSAGVSVTVGSYTVTVTPGDGTMSLGGTLQYTASVLRDGAPVLAPAVTWGSLNPMIASVSPTGLVTALADGDTKIVASYGGAAAQVSLTVAPASAPPPPPPPPPPPALAACSDPGGTVHSTPVTPIGSETWTRAGSPHRVNGNVDVRGAGQILTIEAGVVVCFSTLGNLTFDAGARLVARGTAQQPILFIAADTLGASTAWGVMAFRGTPGDTSWLVNTRIAFGGAGGAQTMILQDFNDHPVVIDSSVARKSLYTAITLRGTGGRLSRTRVDSMRATASAHPMVSVAGSPTIEATLVRGGSGGGIAVTSGTPQITGCLVTGSAGPGLDLYSQIAVTGNDFVGNAGPGILYRNVGVMNAAGNWWGDPAGPAGPNGDGIVATGGGSITVAPVRTTPAWVPLPWH